MCNGQVNMLEMLASQRRCGSHVCPGTSTFSPCPNLRMLELDEFGVSADAFRQLRHLDIVVMDESFSGEEMKIGE